MASAARDRFLIRSSLLIMLTCWLTSHANGQSEAATIAAPPIAVPPIAAPKIRFDHDQLSIEANPRGDTLPDFSHCGYGSNAQAIPRVAVRLELKPTGGDDTEAIQQAIDRLASMPVDAQGWRGAIELSPDNFFVSGTIRLAGDHIVLRGGTAGGRTTTLVATGHSRRALIQLGGERPEVSNAENVASKDSAPKNSASNKSNAKCLDDIARDSGRSRQQVIGYVPLGSRWITLKNTAGFSRGQNVLLRHPSTERWIASIGMNRMPSDDGRGSWLDWKAGAYDQVWLRTITRVEKERIELDVPLTSAIDPQMTDAEVITATAALDEWGDHLGIENLQLISWADQSTNPKDEEHAWDAIRLDHVHDAWVRGVTMQQFAGSAVQIGRNTRCVTVSDCLSVKPISEEAAWRRHTYLTYGQQSLFLRCQAEDGRHGFAVGYLTPGPNAFSHCDAVRASHASGPLGNWSTGVLFDNLTIDGGGLWLTNRETDAQGAGWAAANCVLWNCVAPQIACRQPPGAFNWALGVWGEFTGDGSWNSMNEFVSPSSLLKHQLEQRITRSVAEDTLTKVAFTAPTPVNCDQIVVPRNALAVAVSRQALTKNPEPRLELKNGWLTLGDRIAIGSRQTQAWWRGTTLPAKAAEFGPGLLRFVPGTDERNFTDSIEDIADQMQARHALALEQHWGLWYDRRRDDHQMVRRANADVWPPFYELPWARSGQGQAWDGLSKYDLTRFNRWYFDRLASFANIADQRGLVLMYSMYFQHNILEAGAHWADFAWRPANCLQSTGFPEPPVYQNRKRVFMADDFYDISHPVRRDLHTKLTSGTAWTWLGRNSKHRLVLGRRVYRPRAVCRVLAADDSAVGE